jgi:hypothetical protein
VVDELLDGGPSGLNQLGVDPFVGADGMSGVDGAPNGVPTSGCLAPRGGLTAPWCFVDSTTCRSPLYSLGGKPIEYCYKVGDAVAIDTGTELRVFLSVLRGIVAS